MTTAIILLGGMCLLLIAACVTLVRRLDRAYKQRNAIAETLGQYIGDVEALDAAKRRVLDELRGGQR